MKIVKVNNGIHYATASSSSVFRGSRLSSAACMRLFKQCRHWMKTHGFEWVPPATEHVENKVYELRFKMKQSSVSYGWDADGAPSTEWP